MRIDLQEIEINAIRDIGLNQKVVFPQNQVTSIVGINKDDGGSNGSGKTTLSMAPLLNLYGPTAIGISSKNIKNRYLDAVAWTKGKYLINNKELYIDRVIGGKLSFSYDGQVYSEGKVEDLQEKLNNILSVQPEQLICLSNKAQGDYGGFLLMTDSKKKEFLSSFFDISWIDDINEKAKNEEFEISKALVANEVTLKELENTMVMLQSDLEKAKETSRALNSPEKIGQVASYRNKVIELTNSKSEMELLIDNTVRFNQFINASKDIQDIMYSVSLFKSAYDQANKEMQSKAQEYLSLSLELTDKINVLKNTKPKGQDELNELSEQETSLDLLLKNKNTEASSLSKIAYTYDLHKANLNQQEASFNDIESASCTSCGQSLPEHKQHAAHSKIQLNINGIRASMTNALEAQSLLSSLNIEIEKLRESKANLQSNKAQVLQEIQNDSSKEMLAQLEENLRLLMSNSQTELNSVYKAESHWKTEVARLNQAIESKKLDLKCQLMTTNNSIHEFNNFIAMHETTLDLALKAVLDKQIQIESVNVNITKNMVAKAELNTLSEENKAIQDITSNHGFKGYIFDSLLEDLNSKINNNLKLIPNARKFSLQFSSDKMTKTTKTLSKSITYQIFSEESEVDFNTLSGGEKLSMIIAVDEALDDVLSERLGVLIGWKFLDEQFGWIDENSKEAILEFYKSKSEKKAYFIVDHASEFNASIDSRIQVIKENKIAKVVNL